MNPDFLQRYAMADKDVDFDSALQNGGGKLPSGGVISVESSKTKAEEKYGKLKDESNKKRSKDRGSFSKSSKKRTA